jgi:hypothetical protein
MVKFMFLVYNCDVYVGCLITKQILYPSFSVQNSLKRVNT